MRYCIKKFPLLLKEGWSGRLIILYIQNFISRPGWLIHCFLLTFIGMKNKNLFNRKSLKFFRSSLRNKSISAEAELWNFLKSKKLNARKFRRQYSIGNYIVDFLINHPGRYQYSYHNYKVVRPPLLQKEGKCIRLISNFLNSLHNLLNSTP